jgi:hypothetical protein
MLGLQRRARQVDPSFEGRVHSVLRQATGPHSIPPEERFGSCASSGRLREAAGEEGSCTSSTSARAAFGRAATWDDI